jgi:predicted methyltransferase
MQPPTMTQHLFGLLLKLTLATLAFAPIVNLPAQTFDYAKLLKDQSRSEEDQKADASRKPIEFLNLTQIKPGMNVLDIAAGGGYTTALLSLSTGPNGHVWAQLNKPSPALASRLGTNPGNINVLITPFDDPAPSTLPKMDLITLVLSYHDIAFMPVNRKTMNLALFNALKPGGALILIDHSSKPGHGLQDIKTIHRIDESTVIEDFKSVGFVLQSTSDDWRNPNDPRDTIFSQMSQPDDRFALRFIKP